MLRFLDNRFKNHSGTRGIDRESIYSILLKEDFGTLAVESYDQKKHSIEKYYESLFCDLILENKEILLTNEKDVDFNALRNSIKLILENKEILLINEKDVDFHALRNSIKSFYSETNRAEDLLNKMFLRRQASIYALIASFKVKPPSDIERLELQRMTTHALVTSDLFALRLFLDIGVDPNAQINDYYCTRHKNLMTVAAHHSSNEVFKCLLDAGGDLTAQDKNGCNSLDIAKLFKNDGILRIIDEYIEEKEEQDEEQEKIPDAFKYCSIQ